MSNLVSVQFNNQSLLATMVNDVPYIALKPICENLGIDWEGQRQKIARHPVLSSTACMITAVAQDGKLREMLMMPIKYLNGWLFGIDSTRVNKNAKDAVIKYQEECFEVLANHFMPKRNALVELPASPYVTANEKLQLQKMINTRVKRTNESHSMAWRYLFDAYRVNKMEFLPTGRLNEMCAYMGERTPHQDEMVLIKKRELDELKILPLQQEVALPKGSMIINEERYKQLFDEKVIFDIDRVKYLMKRDNKALISTERMDRILEHLQHQDDRISGMLGIIKGMRESSLIIKDAMEISKQLV